jgi:hypothetical protein
MLKRIDMKNKERIAILEAEISRLKVANRNNIYRIEQIESHLAEQHKGANFSKSNKPESISDAPDYTHLLPEGYEFCQEADAEKWVKVEMKNIHDNDEFRIGSVKCVNIYKGTWLPIRPIQYKVTTHEITTAVPDPYMPDWSKAPEGTVSHAWDANGKSFWYTIVIDKELTSFMIDIERSNAPALPPDLDWKQSLRVKPSK